MKRVLVFLFLAGVVLFTYQQVLVRPGLPFTHDSQMHIARMVNYYVALKQGQLPPRWGPTLNNWFGYPVFNFNYPLPYILAVPFLALKVSAEDTYRIITLLSLFSSVWGMWVLTRERWGGWGSIVASLLYVLNPYQIGLVFVRGTIGETLCFALLPWLLWLIWKVARKKTFSRYYTGALILVGGAYLLAHNIIVLFSLPLIFCWVVWLGRGNIYPWLRMGIAGILAGLLGMFFWIPALGEKQWTVLDEAPLSKDYLFHFPTLAELLHGAWGYGYSLTVDVDSMSFYLGAAQIILFVVVGLLLISKRSFRHPAVILIWFAALASVVYMLSISLPVWQAIPLMQYIQFPWRLAFFWQFFASLLGGFAAYYYRRSWFIWFGVCVLLFITARTLSQSHQQFHFDNVYWFNYAETTSISDENMPKAFDKTAAYALAQKHWQRTNVFLEQADSVVTAVSGNGSSHGYIVRGANATRVVERTAYFPGWEVRIDGRPVAIESTLPQYPGLITFMVPAGTHAITTRFTQSTPPRLWGNGLTLVGIVGCLAWLTWGKRIYGSYLAESA